jgi:hypothetical protein
MTRPISAKRLFVRKGLIIVSIVVWSLVVGSVVVNALWVPTFKEASHLQVGCYLTDALWFYVKCAGFPLSGLAAFVLTLPYLLWLGPILLLFNPLVAVPVWFFLLFPLWYFWSRKRRAPNI